MGGRENERMGGWEDGRMEGLMFCITVNRNRAYVHTYILYCTYACIYVRYS